MKKIMIFVAVIMMAISAQAQDNIVKLGVGGLWYGGINLEYERVLTEKTSILGEIGFTVPRNFGEERINGWVDFFGIQDAESSINITSIKLNTFYFAAEYRYYLGSEVAKGFYAAPYLKLSNYSASAEGNYDNNNLIDIASDIEIQYFTASVGASIGHQWIINDQITVNWNILGLGLGINTVSANFTSTDQNNVFAEWEKDVKEFLDGLPFVGDKFETTSDNATKKIDGSATLISPTFRFGLSIGYMF